MDEKSLRLGQMFYNFVRNDHTLQRNPVLSGGGGRKFMILQY